jgi:hypothetical protein
MKNKSYLIALTLLICVAFFTPSCKKDPVVNPYDQYKPTADSIAKDSIDPVTFQGLYKNIFKPTCANSGCHDGTFEPDFRTIESSYNSLVYQDIIKNYLSSPLPYRVKPGDANNSIIIKRLTEDIDGVSGVMPLAVDPKSDWSSKRSTYIANITTWINNGAKDALGQAPTSLNLVPQMSGFFVAAMGSTSAVSRNSNGVCVVSSSTNDIDLYFGFQDDHTSSAGLTVNEITFSLSANNFSTAVPAALTIISPITETGFSGSSVNFTHKFTMTNLRTLYPTGTQVFVRVKVKDDVNPAVTIPSNETLMHIIQYFSFIVG